MKIHPTKEPSQWQNHLGLVVLVGSYILSVIWVYAINKKYSDKPDDNRKTIRVVHSLAEKNIQSAFNRLAREYEALHPDTRIIIQSIPQRAYKQWVTTQLIGNTAPDLIQAESKWSETWENLASRFWVPLTNYVVQPNPYNSANDLAGRPWRDTYIDGMDGGYWTHLMIYFTVPFTIEMQRIFYNKDLFLAATGSDAPPENYSQWINICKQIKDYAHTNNKPIAPVAITLQQGTGIGQTPIFSRYFPIMTADMLEPLEIMHYGLTDSSLVLFGILTNSFDLKHERIRASFALQRELAQYHQAGFVSDDFSQTQFLFIQESAAMVLGSSRDAKIIKDAADFNVGVFDFPLPEPNHPEYGRYVIGPITELPTGTFHFGLTKLSKYPETAIDFLMYCTSREKNQQFCNDIYWYPVIEDAQPHEFLKPFAPHYEGVSGYPALYIRGGNTELWLKQNYPLFLSGMIDFDQLMDQFKQVWLRDGIRDFRRRSELYVNLVPQGERNFLKIKAAMLFEEAGDFKAGEVVGSYTPYQLSLEVGNPMGGPGWEYIKYHLFEAKDYHYP